MIASKNTAEPTLDRSAHPPLDVSSFLGFPRFPPVLPRFTTAGCSLPAQPVLVLVVSFLVLVGHFCRASPTGPQARAATSPRIPQLPLSHTSVKLPLTSFSGVKLVNSWVARNVE